MKGVKAEKRKGLKCVGLWMPVELYEVLKGKSVQEQRSVSGEILMALKSHLGIMAEKEVDDA